MQCSTISSRGFRLSPRHAGVSTLSSLIPRACTPTRASGSPNSHGSSSDDAREDAEEAADLRSLAELRDMIASPPVIPSVSRRRRSTGSAGDPELPGPADSSLPESSTSPQTDPVAEGGKGKHAGNTWMMAGMSPAAMLRRRSEAAAKLGGEQGDTAGLVWGRG